MTVALWIISICLTILVIESIVLLFVVIRIFFHLKKTAENIDTLTKNIGQLGSSLIFKIFGPVIKIISLIFGLFNWRR